MTHTRSLIHVVHIALHCITLHCTALLNCITLHCILLHYIGLHLHFIALHLIFITLVNWVSNLGACPIEIMPLELELTNFKCNAMIHTGFCVRGR